MTLRELCDAYLADLQGTLAESTHYNRRCFCGRLIRDLGNIPLDALTPDRLRTWKTHLLARYRPSTVRKYLDDLQTILRYAIEQEWLDADPLAKVRKPPAGRGRIRFLAPDERVRLLDACRTSRNPMLYPIVMLALSTGGRKDELRCLQWGQVDLEGEVVRFVKTKNGQARAVPLIGEALTILKGLAQYRRQDVPWVFPTWNGCGPTPMTSAWETARAISQIANLCFHDLRHTYASYLAMSGANLRDIADLLGHSGIQQTVRYTHLTDGHRHQLVEAMLRKFLEQ